MNAAGAPVCKDVSLASPTGGQARRFPHLLLRPVLIVQQPRYACNPRAPWTHRLKNGCGNKTRTFLDVFHAIRQEPIGRTGCAIEHAHRTETQQYGVKDALPPARFEKLPVAQNWKRHLRPHASDRSREIDLCKAATARGDALQEVALQIYRDDQGDSTPIRVAESV